VVGTVIVVLGWLAMIAVVLAAAVVAARLYTCRTYPQAIVFATLCLLTFVAIGSNALSLVSRLHVGEVRAIWLVALVVLIVLVVRRRERIPRPIVDVSDSEKVLYALTAVILLLALASGLLVAPNNWDSLTYHLPRAAHWLQVGNLDFFPTTITRQNLITQAGDLVTTHLLATAPDARLVSLGQWASGLVILVGVGILARALFGAGRVVALAVLFAASIPMLVSQLSTTQVDLLAGVPVVGAVLAVVQWRGGQRTMAIVAMALSVALAVAIKTTALLYLVPILVLFLALVVRSHDWRRLGLLAAMGLVAGVLLNGSFLWAIAHSPSVGEDVLSQVFVGGPSPGVLVLNLIRDTATAMQSTLPGTNAIVESAADWLLAALNLDPAAAVTPVGTSFQLYVVMDENMVGAPLQVLFVVLALLGLALTGQQIRRWEVRAYLLVLAAQWLVVAAILNWQPWVNRFTFMTLVLAAPAVGWLLDVFPRYARVGTVVVLAASAVGWGLVQPWRGLAGTAWLPSVARGSLGMYTYPSPLGLDRLAQVLNNTPHLVSDYRSALHYAAGLKPDAVQLSTGNDDFEYVVWDALSTQATMPVIGHEGDRAVTAGPGRRVVRICTAACDTADLVDPRVFPEKPSENPLAWRVPPVTVGLVRYPS
jgi:hypothetical protein